MNEKNDEHQNWLIPTYDHLLSNLEYCRQKRIVVPDHMALDVRQQ